MRSRRGNTPTKPVGTSSPVVIPNTGKPKIQVRRRLARIFLVSMVSLLILLGAATRAFTQLDFFGVFVTESIMHFVMPRPQFYKQLSEDPHSVFPSLALLSEHGYYHLKSLEVFGVSSFDSLRTDSDLGLTTLVRDKQKVCGILLALLDADAGRSHGHDESLVHGFCKLANSSTETFYYFHRPSLTKYGPYQWLWDSCFHIMIESRRSVVPALLELFSLFTFQHATGFIPEMTYWHSDPNQRGIGGFLFGYSDPRFTDITQMPMLAYPVEQIFNILKQFPSNGKLDLSEEFGSVFFRRVKRYVEYWHTHRDTDRDGLVSIIHPWESGLDASPLYDAAHYASPTFSSPPKPDELYPKFIVLLYRYRHHAMWNLQNILRHDSRFDVEDIGVNSVLADNSVLMDSLSPLAPNPFIRTTLERIFSSNSEEPARLASYGWSPSEKRKIPLHAKTIQRLLVLLITSDAVLSHHETAWRQKVLRTEQKLLSELSDAHDFALPFGVPTTAKSEKSFDPLDSSLMWRGPTWPTTNWFVARALSEIVDRDCRALTGAAQSLCSENQATAEAILLRLAESWLRLHATHGFSEYFNPISGEPLESEIWGMSLQSWILWLHSFHQQIAHRAQHGGRDSVTAHGPCGRPRLHMFSEVREVIIGRQFDVKIFFCLTSNLFQLSN